ncbi:MAG TPA: hypothetical protein VGI40_15500 [Pirellulaceae bacterium]
MSMRLCVIFLPLAVFHFNAAISAAEIDPIKIALLADDMANRGSSYDATELHALGADGLTAVLDYLLPDTAPPRKLPEGPPEEEIRQLILRLDADDFRVRESATEELIACAKARRKLIEEGASSDSLEVRLRCERVLASWESRPTARLNAYLSGYWAYVEGLRDAAELKLLAERTIKILDGGMPEGDRLHFVRLCIAGVAHGHDNASCDLLRPLVRHADVRIATLVVETAGAYKTEPQFVPQLLVDAITDPRSAVAEAALRFVLGAQDTERRAAIFAALKSVFDGRDESLRFQACLPLVRDYHDADAWLYVVQQTASQDTNRARTAFNWIGDTKNCGEEADPRFLERLAAMCSTAPVEQRRTAAQALGAFVGRDVVLRLIAMLGDSDTSVSRQANACLLAQPDKQLVAQLLESTLAKNGDKLVHSRVKDLMSRLRRTE